MASNPVPLVIPCHRIIAGNGSIGGFSARTGVALKERLLELEGIAATGGRVAGASGRVAAAGRSSGKRRSGKRRSGKRGAGKRGSAGRAGGRPR
jgi:hypothetical protein